MVPGSQNRIASVTEVRILRLAAGGDGIGRMPDGRTVFVPRTAPDDLVEIGELREHKRFVRARLRRVLEPSPNRVDPRCPHYVVDECGGCQLQHLDSDAQLRSRSGFVGDALRRIAKRETGDPPVVPSERNFEYRTKITLHADGKRSRIGLRRYDRPDQIFDLHWCHITVEPLMRLWQSLRGMRTLLPRTLEQLVLRLDRGGNRHLIVRVGEGEVWGGASQLWRELQRADVESTIWYQPFEGVARTIAGSPEAFPATVFEQVHPEMGDRVRSYALDQLGDVSGRRVWDLYAGVGAATVALVAGGARVESVELDRRAVEEAEARGPVARRHVGRVEDLLSVLQPPDLVLTNPPRSGMDERVTAVLDRIRPTRLVYISCDPATLARDLQRMPHLRLERVQAFDLFPQTAHVESVAVLEPA
ncbi:MAG TPA: TRAM domain-containing protein [Gemmatimonadales bacterium]